MLGEAVPLLAGDADSFLDSSGCALGRKRNHADARSRHFKGAHRKLREGIGRVSGQYACWTDIGVLGTRVVRMYACGLVFVS